jgi:hypothetical protein
MSFPSFLTYEKSQLSPICVQHWAKYPHSSDARKLCSVSKMEAVACVGELAIFTKPIFGLIFPGIFLKQ